MTAIDAERTVAILEDAIPDRMAGAGVPAVSAALVADGALAWRRAYGVKSAATGEPVDARTVFETASITKPVFAYAALRLCEDGALDLDAPLVRYYPEPYTAYGFVPDEPRLRRVTTRHVLSHTAGFGNWQRDRIGRLVGEPGAAWFYGGEGYMFLQRVIERVTGTPLGPYMRDRVLAPLGMRDSSLTWLDRYAGQAARGHGDVDRSGAGSEWPRAIAAYSLYTTPADLAAFLSAMMRTGPGDAHHLGGAWLDAMVAPQIAIDQRLSWALGWGLVATEGGPCFWQWGDLGNFQGYAIGSRPLRWGLVLMTNGDRGLRLCAAVVAAALGEEYAAPLRTVLERGW